MMASVVSRWPVVAPDNRFFVITAILMALINIGAFSFFAAMGISSFHAPVSVHIHAILFMGWVLLFVSQVSFAATGSLALHRKLGLGLDHGDRRYFDNSMERSKGSSAFLLSACAVSVNEPAKHYPVRSAIDRGRC
jgi:hypothetical protein